MFVCSFCCLRLRIESSLAAQSTNDLLNPATVSPATLDEASLLGIDITSLGFDSEFDAHYGLLAPEQTVLVRAYSDDTDDQMLAEIRPRFIVMFEPNQDFIRRIEVSCITSLDLMWHRYARAVD